MPADAGAQQAWGEDARGAADKGRTGLQAVESSLRFDPEGKHAPHTRYIKAPGPTADMILVPSQRWGAPDVKRQWAVVLLESLSEPSEVVRAKRVVVEWCILKACARINDVILRCARTIPAEDIIIAICGASIRDTCARIICYVACPFFFLGVSSRSGMKLSPVAY